MCVFNPIPIGNPPIAQGWLGVWFRPIGKEPDPGRLRIVRDLGLIPWREFPRSMEVDPFEFADTLVLEWREMGESRPQVYLFIPGRLFDRFGTRHGRGVGWMDRFLSRVPREWLRIGIVGEGQWSENQLKREEWDEGMDWVVGNNLPLPPPSLGGG